MRFYFDESGTFCVPENADHHTAGIVVGVIVPECVETEFFKCFRQFITRLPSSALKNGEVKGRYMDDKARRAFATLISRSEGIQVCPTILDLAGVAGRGPQMRDSLPARLEGLAAQCVYETMRDEVNSLADEVRGMSPQQIFRFRAWGRAIDTCVRDAIVWYSGAEYQNCWNEIKFELDCVEQGSNSREERVFSLLLPGWLMAGTQKKPIILVQEHHTDDHPFVQNWETDRGIDLGKMLRDNLRFCSSQASLGVQVADIASYIVRRAVIGIVRPYNLRTYGLMICNSVRSDTHAHGLTFLGKSAKLDITRYFGLVQAIAEAREMRRRRPLEA